jgi:hypothetical protein
MWGVGLKWSAVAKRRLPYSLGIQAEKSERITRVLEETLRRNIWSAPIIRRAMRLYKMNEHQAGL